jgi:hypothetical protein
MTLSIRRLDEKDPGCVDTVPAAPCGVAWFFRFWRHEPVMFLWFSLTGPGATKDCRGRDNNPSQWQPSPPRA